MYTAIILDSASRQKLLRKYYEMHPLPPSGWVLKAHHVTLNMGEAYKSVPYREEGQTSHDILGSLCEISVTSLLYKAEGIEAVGVDIGDHPDYLETESGKRIFCMNKQPHITIAHRGDVAAKTANDYPESWLRARSALYPQYLTGRIEEVK